MIKHTLMALLCIGVCLAPCVLHSASAGLDDVPWSTIKGLSLGSSRETYAKAFGSKHPPMAMGTLKLWPAIFANNRMTAGIIRDEKVVAVMWTWKQLPEVENRVLTSTIFQYLKAQDAAPTQIQTQKVIGERIANVLALTFHLPQFGASTRAIFTASELETTVIIHDGTTLDIEEAVNKSNTESLLKKDEQPITIRDYLSEHLAKEKPGNEQQLHPTQPSINPSPSVQPPAPKKAPEARATTSPPSEESPSSTPWSIIVVLIVAATGLLWLLVKKRK